MHKFVVQISETINYELVVEASSKQEAKTKALYEWNSAPTIDQWEVEGTQTQVVSVNAPSPCP